MRARFTTINPFVHVFLLCTQAPVIDPVSQTPVTSYTVFYKESSEAAFTSVWLSPTVTMYYIPNPVLFATYEVKVTAANVGGNSAESDTVTKGNGV